MWNRWIGIVFAALMLSANTALLIHDVFPAWFAGAPPVSTAFDLHRGQSIRLQTGIYDSRGARVGTNWSESLVSGEGPGERIRTKSRTHLRIGALIPNTNSADLVIRTHLTFLRRGQLEEVDLYVGGLLADFTLKGERFAENEFPVQWTFADQRGSFMLPTNATDAIGDAIRPFHDLPGLFVGRSWRVNVVNPLAHLTGRDGPGGSTNDWILFRVTAEEEILHRGEFVRTFRIEAPQMRAWADEAGRVLRQEVELPLIGRLTLLDEPYEEYDLAAPRRRGRR